MKKNTLGLISGLIAIILIGILFFVLSSQGIYVKGYCGESGNPTFKVSNKIMGQPPYLNTKEFAIQRRNVISSSNVNCKEGEMIFYPSNESFNFPPNAEVIITDTECNSAKVDYTPILLPPILHHSQICDDKGRCCTGTGCSFSIELDCSK